MHMSNEFTHACMLIYTYTLHIHASTYAHTHTNIYWSASLSLSLSLSRSLSLSFALTQTHKYWSASLTLSLFLSQIYRYLPAPSTYIHVHMDTCIHTGYRQTHMLTCFQSTVVENTYMYTWIHAYIQNIDTHDTGRHTCSPASSQLLEKIPIAAHLRSAEQKSLLL